MAQQQQVDSLTTDLAGIRLRNPVLLAAGTAGYVDELAGAMDLTAVGGVVTKSITDQPREGNPTWRILETRGGMLNAIGLANVGRERFASEYALKAAGAPCETIGSVAGDSVKGYVNVVKMFDAVDAISIVEVNVSCPNVRHGRSFGDDAGMLAELVAAVRAATTRLRVFVKLPPVLTDAPDRDIVAIANAALDAGADGLTICNTLPAMAIDVETRRPRLANVTGGLSGPALHAVALRLVHDVYRRCASERGAPIVGSGGVTSWRDAAEFILAGATAVQMGTAVYADPRSPARVVRGLSAWVRKQGEARIGELVGQADLTTGENDR